MPLNHSSDVYEPDYDSFHDYSWPGTDNPLPEEPDWVVIALILICVAGFAAIIFRA